MQKLISQDNPFIKNLSYLFLFIAFSILVFFPTIFGDPFWDDWVYIFKKSTDVMNASNPLVFFPGGSASTAWPVFHFILWSMVKIFKAHYAFYHLVNLSFHGVNGFLCWKLLERIKVKNSLLLALLYMVHPLQLFTAAWLIQTKTIFSIFFFLVSMFGLLNYLQHQDELYKKKILSLAASIVFFVLSILTKSTTVTFVACLILGFPFVKDKINIKKFILYFLVPLILVASFSTVRTLWNYNIKDALSTEADVTSYKDMTIVDRVVITPKIFLRYAIFVLLPLNGHHLFQENTVLSYSPAEFLWIVAGLTLLYYLFRYLKKNKLHRELFGLIFFCVSIVPFCGIVFIPIFATSNFVPYWLSIPFLGLLPLISHVISSNKVLIVTVATLTIVSHIQAYSFINTEEIFLESIKLSPDSKVYQVALVEHYVFTHQCKSAAEAYTTFFEKTRTPIYKLHQKVSTCEQSRQGSL